MATKRRSFQDFSCTINGNEYRFECYTTDTRDGFCHTVRSLDYDVPATKVGYLNRTWEDFKYQSALRKMIRKFPAAWQEEMTRQLVEAPAEAEREKCDAQLGAFQKLYDGLTPENKERMKSFPTLQNEGDVRACMLFMGLMNLTQGATK